VKIAGAMKFKFAPRRQTIRHARRKPAM